MEPRGYDLPTDLQYVLDGATEEHEMLSCHRWLLDLYGNPKVIDDITEAPRPQGKFYIGRRAMVAELCAYAESFLPHLPEYVVAGFVNFGFAHARKIVADTAQCHANWAFNDESVGGCALSFRRHPRTRRNGLPSKGVMRRIESPSFIRRSVKLSDSVEFYKTPCAILERFERPDNLDAGDAFNDFLDQQIRIRRERQYAAIAAFQASRKDKADKKPYRVVRRDEKARRKVVARAAVVAVGLLGQPAVAAFAAGKPVVLAGESVDLRVRPRGKLSGLGHGALHVSVLDKSGLRLSDLCVYHQDTPALDQLSAFALSMQAGQEAEIIQTGNLYGVTDRAVDHPLLKAKGFAPTARTTTAFKLAEQAYAEKTAPIWREAVAIRLFGRRWKSFV